MKNHSDEFSVDKMASVLEVSRSGYYAFINRATSKRSQENKLLLEQIKMIHEQSRQTYGSPRIYQALTLQGGNYNHKRIERLMKENNIVAKMSKRFKVTTKSNPHLAVASNLLQQDFSAIAPNEKWSSDITYIWTEEGWLYLAVILDLYSRYIIGLSMSARMTKQLVINAFTQAMVHRGHPKEFIYHSDRGGQYASDKFQDLLKSNHIKASMSGAGNCYDNAVVESFFHSLKTECVYFERYQTRAEAENSIFDYVETFYNRQRLHSYLDYSTPQAFEEQYYQSQ